MRIDFPHISHLKKPKFGGSRGGVALGAEEHELSVGLEVEEREGGDASLARGLYTSTAVPGGVACQAYHATACGATGSGPLLPR